MVLFETMFSYLAKGCLVFCHVVASIVLTFYYQ